MVWHYWLGKLEDSSSEVEGEINVGRCYEIVALRTRVRGRGNQLLGRSRSQRPRARRLVLQAQARQRFRRLKVGRCCYCWDGEVEQERDGVSRSGKHQGQHQRRQFGEPLIRGGEFGDVWKFQLLMLDLDTGHSLCKVLLREKDFNTIATAKKDFNTIKKILILYNI